LRDPFSSVVGQAFSSFTDGSGGSWRGPARSRGAAAVGEMGAARSSKIERGGGEGGCCYAWGEEGGLRCGVVDLAGC
jgi:hypothetical protein